METPEADTIFGDTKHNIDTAIKIAQDMLQKGLLKPIQIKSYMALIGQITGILDLAWERGRDGKGEQQKPGPQELADFIRKANFVVLGDHQNL